MSYLVLCYHDVGTNVKPLWLIAPDIETKNTWLTFVDSVLAKASATLSVNANPALSSSSTTLSQPLSNPSSTASSSLLASTSSSSAASTTPGVSGATSHPQLPVQNLGVMQSAPIIKGFMTKYIKGGRDKHQKFFCVYANGMLLLFIPSSFAITYSFLLFSVIFGYATPISPQPWWVSLSDFISLSLLHSPFLCVYRMNPFAFLILSPPGVIKWGESEYNLKHTSVVVDIDQDLSDFGDKIAREDAVKFLRIKTQAKTLELLTTSQVCPLSLFVFLFSPSLCLGLYLFPSLAFFSVLYFACSAESTVFLSNCFLSFLIILSPPFPPSSPLFL